MIRYKTDIMDRLREKGFTSYKLRHDKILGESIIQQLRVGGVFPNKSLNKLCQILGCDISDILEYVPDSDMDRSE